MATLCAVHLISVEACYQSIRNIASSGSGYDLSASTFSPDGRIFQVEYAAKAVDQADTVMGIKCSTLEYHRLSFVSESVGYCFVQRKERQRK
jgi:Proteasome subunit A N-terminal signature